MTWLSSEDALILGQRILLAIALGFVSSFLHFLKKKYVDMSTKDSFLSYFHWNDPYFRKSLFTLVFAEVCLGYSSYLQPLNLDLIIAFLSTGYANDSIFNRSSEQQ